MYETFFGMEHTPFRRNIPADRLYRSEKLEDAVGRLRYTSDNELFTVVLSEPGCGKSTLIRMFKSTLPPEKYMLMYLSDSKLTPRWLYAGLLDQMGLEAKFYRGDSKRKLQKAIGQIKESKRKVICVLDEAHLLGRETLEEFRFLLNYEYDSEEEVYKVSSGIPSMINRICEKSLMYASQQKKRLIDGHMVRYVAEHEMLKR